MDPPSESASSSSNSSSSQAAQWLRENFEYCSDSHIAREKIYQEYLDICASRGIDVLNSASFGKVIRMIFPHVATRRLGTRGNSK